MSELARTSWLSELRRIHDLNFDVDWAAHLRAVNDALELRGDHEFGLPAGLPPAWFVGDVEAIQSPWVLVLSLNQARREEDDAWHLARRYTRQSYWDHWRWLNRDWWEPRFYRPIVRLAAASLDVTVEVAGEAAFATNRMVFVELCPYPSRRFELGGARLRELAESDVGLRIASEVRRVLIEEAAPSLVLVNGVGAVDALRAFDSSIGFHSHRYPSVDRPAKALWHEAGQVRAGARSIPVVGFPFLRKPSTHNSYAEIGQLAAAARRLVGTA